MDFCAENTSPSSTAVHGGHYDKCEQYTAVVRCVVGVGGAVWLDEHRVIHYSHGRPGCLHLTGTDLELRLHNTVSNPHSGIESFLLYKYSQHVQSRTASF